MSVHVYSIHVYASIASTLLTVRLFMLYTTAHVLYMHVYNKRSFCTQMLFGSWMHEHVCVQ